MATITLKSSISTIRAHLRQFIKVVHPDVVGPVGSLEKVQNGKSLAELNSFMDMTSSVCLVRGQRPPPSLSQTFDFLFHIPNDNALSAGSRNISVTIQLPPSFRGQGTLNSLHKRQWVSLTAKGVAQLLDGANLPVPSDLEQIYRSRSGPSARKPSWFGRGRGEGSSDLRVPVGVDLDLAVLEHMYDNGFGEESDCDLNLGRESIVDMSNETLKKRQSVVIGIVAAGCLHFADELTDDETHDGLGQFMEFMIEHFSYFMVSEQEEIWKVRAKIVLCKEEESKTSKWVGVVKDLKGGGLRLMLPYSVHRSWGAAEAYMLHSFINTLANPIKHGPFGRGVNGKHKKRPVGKVNRQK